MLLIVSVKSIFLSTVLINEKKMHATCLIHITTFVHFFSFLCIKFKLSREILFQNLSLRIES